MGLGRFLRRGARQAQAREPSPPAGGGQEANDPGSGAADLSYSLGQARPDEQRAAALERLAELRADGKVSEENYLKEKRRLERWG